MTELGSGQSANEILLNTLRRIDESVSDVRERVIRLEAEGYGARIASLEKEIDAERNRREIAITEARVKSETAMNDEKEKRQKLEIEITRLKTQFGPILTASAMIGGGVITWFLTTMTGG